MREDAIRFRSLLMVGKILLRLWGWCLAARRSVANLVVQFNGITSKKGLCMATIGLGRGVYVNMV